MHEKVEHLFAQNTHRQKDIRQNKLPVPLLTLSVPEKLKKSIFEMPINPQNLNITWEPQVQRDVGTKCKMMSEGRSVLSPAQRGTGSESVKVSVKNQNNIGNLLKLLEKWLAYKVSRFWMVLTFFWFCLTRFLRCQ